MLENSAVNKKIHYALRVASGMCFIGHGAWGIIKKLVWCNYFAVFGIDQHVSFTLMPYLGAIDILMGIIILAYPMRGLLMWLVIWGFVTALLRPLAGEPFAEFIERAGNYGAPMALLILSGGNRFSLKNLLKSVTENPVMDAKTMAGLVLCLRVVVFLLFLGHGWLNVTGKQGLLNQYQDLGFANPLLTAQIVGLLEITGAFSVLIRPLRPVLLVLFFWKMSSELFYPHYEFFEWVERAGSYASIIALWFALGRAPAFITTNLFRRQTFSVQHLQGERHNSTSNQS